MLFPNCCCTERHELNTDGVEPATRVSDEPLIIFPESNVNNMVSTPAEIKVGAASETMPVFNGETPHMINTEKAAEEKLQLREIVTNFGRRALPGAPCTYLGQKGESRSPAKYYLDKELKSFWVASPEDKGNFLHPSLRLHQVKKLCTMKADEANAAVLLGGEGFPEDLVKSLADEEFQRTVLVSHEPDENTGLAHFFILEETAEKAESLAQSMKVLAIYASSQSNTA